MKGEDGTIEIYALEQMCPLNIKKRYGCIEGKTGVVKQEGSTKSTKYRYIDSMVPRGSKYI